jgi:hypothetical protein
VKRINIAMLAVLLLGTALCAPAAALGDERDEKDMAFDLGVGLLEFIHVDIVYLHSRSWSFGLSLGGLPLDYILRAAMGVEEIEGQVDVEGFIVKGKVDTELLSSALWARWYPWARTFYVEATLSVWTLKAAAPCTFSHSDIQAELDFKVNAKVTVPMFGLHCGWRFFWENGAYLDLGLGLNTIQTAGAEVDADPGDISQYPDAEALLNQGLDTVSKELKRGANQITKDMKAFSTVFIRFGWAFDFW